MLQLHARYLDESPCSRYRLSIAAFKATGLDVPDIQVHKVFAIDWYFTSLEADNHPSSRYLLVPVVAIHKWNSIGVALVSLNVLLAWVVSDPFSPLLLTYAACRFFPLTSFSFWQCFGLAPAYTRLLRCLQYRHAHSNPLQQLYG